MTAVSIVVANGGSVEDYEGVNKSSRAGIPIVAVNTTAGTGSEVTSFSVITDRKNGNIKYPLADYSLTPDVAIIDPQFTWSMPKSIVADTGLDVLTHAIMDALLGAAGLGDIGKLFPDSEERYRGISSLLLLKEVGKRLRENGWQVVNLDSTIVAQAPKLAPFLVEMQGNLAHRLGIPADRVNVKATTEEHLGFTGNGEGIAAHAVALVLETGDR